jgi:hypothetical protein
MYLMFQTWDRDQDGKFAAEVFFWPCKKVGIYVNTNTHTNTQPFLYICMNVTTFTEFECVYTYV